MKSRELSVRGAFEFVPEVFEDPRGIFVSPFQESAFESALGHRLFPVAQTNHSRSRAGVVRGAHFTVTPPGTAKYVYCARGSAVDIVIDIRVNSPTFGAWDTAVLDPVGMRAMYLPVGVAHAFVALEDNTVMSYMLSGEYVRENELALSVFDPEIGVVLPRLCDPVLSERDRDAPGLTQLQESGLLPDYGECRRIERAMYGV
ncbi:dTDP-4-keto-6-deoxy-D-glucose epimerase [Thermobifida alba]|uniref:dTDP-4-keto-6-deoxy-D-glucose epimerase n=1 Tax=Thermobifida alba TaxID=53522 RepID=A0ABY4L3C9_THEAE|nr:dTDP-4-dehydrorhamnose 3,5-epimerase family protein [Thermobifida alba]UPT20823.1 dTDP-4-keto-6-deoxy-D-glucose epimerase [Thermobifida alba]